MRYIINSISSQMKFLTLALIFWCVFFDLYISAIGGGASVAVGIIFLVFTSPLTIFNMKFDRDIQRVFLLSFFYYAYVVLRSMFSEDIHYLISASKIILTLFISIYITSYVLHKYGTIFYIKLLIFIFFIQSLSPVLYISFDSIKTFAIALQAPDILGRDIHGRGVFALRKSFLSGSGGFFGMAVVLGFFAYILTFFYIKRSISFWCFIITFLVVSIAAVIAGRVASMFIVSSIIIFFFYSKISVKILLFILVMLVFSVSYYMIFYTGLLQWLISEYIFLGWMLEPLVNMVEGGNFSSDSTSMLMNMWYIPSLSTVIIGDGLYLDNGGYYGGTDVGFIRQLLFGGLPIIFFSILFPFYISKNMPALYRLLFIFLIFFVHAKGNVIYGAPMTMALLVSFYTYLNYLPTCGSRVEQSVTLRPL